MTHTQLSDLFADTYTFVKQEFLINPNSISIFSNDIENEQITFSIDDKNVVLSKKSNEISIDFDNYNIFTIPILDEPQKTIKLEEKGVEFLKKIANFNSDLKISLNIKSYLTDDKMLSSAIRLNKNKLKL
tara:strand:+ start:9433 stop:9822 length:390 start_codon:yes stop_codon:yes gene_type:complete